MNTNEYKLNKACSIIDSNKWDLNFYGFSIFDNVYGEFINSINYGIDDVRYRLRIFICSDMVWVQMYRDFVERIPWYNLYARYRYNGYRIKKDYEGIDIFLGNNMPLCFQNLVDKLRYVYGHDEEMDKINNFFG